MAGILGLLMSGAGLIKDQYFNLTTLLLPGNGTNGANNNTFLDSSSNNFTLTRSGNTTQGTFSPFSQTGWGNYFNGTNAQLSAANNAAFAPGSGDFTAECWIYSSAATAGSLIMGHITSGGAANTNWAIYKDLPSAGNIGFYASDGTTYQINGIGGGSVNDSRWHHIAVSRSGSSFRVFVDGTQVGSTGTWAGTIASGAYPFKIGYNGTSAYFNGYISNIRMVKGGALYTSNFTPSTTPLTTTVSSGTVSILTCQSNRFIDNSTNNFTITVTGTPSVVAFSPFNPTASWSAATNGGSGYFDGSGDVLTATNSTLQLNGTFTVDCFFYITNLSSNRGIWINGNNDSDRVQLIVLSTGVIEVYARTASTPSAPFPIQLTSSSGVIVANQWYQVTVTSDNSTAKLYVNGTEIVSGSVLSALPTVNDFNIGRARSQSVNRDMAGYISNVRVVKGSVVVPPAGGYSSPLTAIPDTALLLNFTNAGIYDATSKNDLETVESAQISNTTAQFGGTSIKFNGTTDYLAFPSTSDPRFDFGTGDFTVECWIYLNSIPSDTFRYILSFGTSGSSQRWLLRFDTRTAIESPYLIFYSLNSSNVITTIVKGGGSSGWSSGVWYYVAVTRSGNDFKLFRDGLQNGATVIDDSPVPGTASTGRMYIGAEVGGSALWDGYIQDVRITRGYARPITSKPTAAFPTL